MAGEVALGLDTRDQAEPAVRVPGDAVQLRFMARCLKDVDPEVLTPLLDQRSASMIAGLARSGRFVVAVDTLPPGLRPAAVGDWAPLAHRLWRMSRENVIGQLREHGVPVVAWAGAGSLDEPRSPMRLLDHMRLVAALHQLVDLR